MNVEVDVLIKHETGLALLVNDGDQDVWIPKSEVKDFDWDEDYIGQDTTITIPEWRAIDKGLV